MDKLKAIEKLKSHIQALNQFKYKESQGFEKWMQDTILTIRHVFGQDSIQLKEFCSINWGPAITFTSSALLEREKVRKLRNNLFIKNKDKAAAFLSSFVDEIEEYGENDNKTLLKDTPERNKTGPKIFIVHGHHKSKCSQVERFLDELKLEPIVLHKQPNKGRTIIEKFEKYSDVSFAVVLLTGDDRGGIKNAPSKTFKLRARQNVILELGFFLGKLGRDRVCALYENRVEIPSDYNGVLFVPFDKSGDWQQSLAQEIKAAGLPINLGKAINNARQITSHVKGETIRTAIMRELYNKIANNIGALRAAQLLNEIPSNIDSQDILRELSNLKNDGYIGLENNIINDSTRIFLNKAKIQGYFKT